MKSVLISIQPKWCELIASGQKTVEVRKTKPKLATPFKVYIYQTLHRENNGRTYSDGKVIGEFVCDKIVEFENSFYEPAFGETSDLSCVGYDDLAKYLGKKDYGYGWHISDLVIYDKPKLLRWFHKPCICTAEYDGEEYRDCLNCDLAMDSDYGVVACNRPITRPPQSWCYVEGVDLW